MHGRDWQNYGDSFRAETACCWLTGSDPWLVRAAGLQCPWGAQGKALGSSLEICDGHRFPGASPALLGTCVGLWVTQAFCISELLVSLRFPPVELEIWLGSLSHAWATRNFGDTDGPCIAMGVWQWQQEEAGIPRMVPLVVAAHLHALVSR